MKAKFFFTGVFSLRSFSTAPSAERMTGRAILLTVPASFANTLQ
jgi:hypothetical protein